MRIRFRPGVMTDVFPVLQRPSAREAASSQRPQGQALRGQDGFDGSIRRCAKPRIEVARLRPHQMAVRTLIDEISQMLRTFW